MARGITDKKSHTRINLYEMKRWRFVYMHALVFVVSVVSVTLSVQIRSPCARNRDVSPSSPNVKEELVTASLNIIVTLKQLRRKRRRVNNATGIFALLQILSWRCVRPQNGSYGGGSETLLNRSSVIDELTS